VSEEITSPEEVQSTVQERLASQQQLPPTSSSAWRSTRKEGFVVELPSGNKARVRRTLDLFDLVRQGKVPNKLIKVVQQMMGGGRNMKEMNLSPEELDSETLQEMTKFIDVCCTRVMIEPRCMFPPDGDPEPELWDPPEGAISIFDLGEEDKLYLFHLAQGGVADIEKFRIEQKAALAALSNVNEVQPEAEQPAVAG
jgi:hypothetical protein